MELNEDGERQCLRCEEWWPDDEEFFKNNEALCCLACAKEVRKEKPLNSVFTIPRSKLEKQLLAIRAASLAANRGAKI